MSVDFDPEGTFTNDSSVFGMPKDINSKLELLPVAWEPTTSFKKGTVKGPQAIFEATKQMDLYHPYFKKAYEVGISWSDDFLNLSLKLNQETSPKAEKIIASIESGNALSSSALDFVNEKSAELNNLIYKKTLESKKVVGLVGGDHSCPFGLIKALSEKYKGDFSIVHIDAHFDFRDEYQGFTHSHASIMHNVKTKLKNPPSIYQLGIRDFCESEYKFALDNSTFLLDQELHGKLLKGKNFHDCLDELFKGLNKNIYISFDIDGLSPEFCPNTGTPVPGGLTYNQATYLIQYLHQKGHSLIGFDLVEVSPNEKSSLGEGLDEVIASRLLYELSCFALSSN
ncbi:MAG: agmatinase family protein [Bdellovibrionales bacterium]